METQGSSELLTQVLDKGLCTGCGACLEICPYFKSYLGKVTRIFECNLQKGRCYAHCPKTPTDQNQLSEFIHGESSPSGELGTYKEIHASKAGQNAVNGSFQNGGSVSALMEFAIKSGFINNAVLTGSNGLLPDPKLVSRVEEIIACSQTKYAASPVVSVLNKAVAEGKNGIGIVGTACQLTGTAKLRLNPLNKEGFKDPLALTIGLFCTWSLDTRKILSLLEDKIDLKSVTGMDVPPPPAEVLIVKTKTGDFEIPLSDIRPLIPKGCGLCSDMTAQWSDISVGAFEGKPDWNTLIVRTERGAELVRQANEQGYLELDGFPSSSLEHLTQAALNKKQRADSQHSAK